MATVYLNISELKFWYKTNPRKLIILIELYSEIERKNNPFVENNYDDEYLPQEAYIDQIFF